MCTSQSSRCYVRTDAPFTCSVKNTLMVKKKKKKKERRSDDELRRTSLKGRRPARKFERGSIEILRPPVLHRRRSDSSPGRHGDNDKWNVHTLNIYPEPGFTLRSARLPTYRFDEYTFHDRNRLKAGFVTFKK